MLMRKASLLVVAVVLAGAWASQTAPAKIDLSGTWTGSFNSTKDGQTRESSAFVVLKHAGDAVTGTAGPREDKQMPIAKGKVVTEKGVTVVTFEASTGGDGPISFSLKLTDGRLKGTASGTDGGQKVTAEVNLGRAK